ADRAFVEHVWARRKVGYLLDQIRAHGEKKELVDEVVALAKRYGIATPYTSYLVVPDAAVPGGGLRGRGQGAGGGGGFGGVGGGGGATPPALQPVGAAAPLKVTDFARQAGKDAGGLAADRERFEDGRLRAAVQGGAPGEVVLSKALGKKEAYDKARE